MSFYPKRADDFVKPTLDTGPGLTKQSHKEQVDINYIVRKYQKTGLLEFARNVAPTFMEVDAIDYQEALQIVLEGQRAFDEMPSNMRKRFRYDPAEFLAFTENPDNLEEMYDMGLATRPVQEVSPEPVVPTPPVETPSPQG